MERDEILKMEAGREMDKMVHRKVFGWVRMELPAVPKWQKPTNDGTKCWYASVPHYSTYIAAAWEVVEKFENESPCLMRTEEGWEFLISKPYGCSAADTAPLAICRAALIAMAEVNDGLS